MTASLKHLPITDEQLADFCQKHHIQRMSVFGSVLRDDFRPDSDVDFLVEFEQGHHPGWFIVDVCEELSKMVGREVDVVNPKFLKHRLKDTVLKSARLIYTNA